MDTPAANNMPVQLRLFGDEVDDALCAQSPAYQGLSDTGQRVVRAYLLALADGGGFPSQVRVAQVAGLSRHAVQDQLANPSSLARAAITQILAGCRDELAVRGSVAIPYIAWLILEQFAPRAGHMPRATSSLTKVELEVLRVAAAMGGVAPADGGAAIKIAAGSSPDGGAAVSVSIGGGEDQGLAALVSKLRAAQAGQAVGGAMREAGQSAGGEADAAGGDG